MKFIVERHDLPFYARTINGSIRSLRKIAQPRGATTDSCHNYLSTHVYSRKVYRGKLFQMSPERARLTMMHPNSKGTGAVQGARSPSRKSLSTFDFIAAR
jgi:hypothetical protein